MKECTEKKNPNLNLEFLKKKYRDKHIVPLFSFFTHPPKMYDSDQIRLRKQIERMLEDLDKAEVCFKCEGRGVIIEKVKHIISYNQNWRYFLTSTNGDYRAITSDFCYTCFGNGIVFANRLEVGSLIKSDQLSVLKCEFCGHIIEDLEYNVNSNLIAYCDHCKISYFLEQLAFRTFCIKKIDT